jgi:hypothetical protein
MCEACSWWHTATLTSIGLIKPLAPSGLGLSLAWFSLPAREVASGLGNILACLEEEEDVRGTRRLRPCPCHTCVF